MLEKMNLGAKKIGRLRLLYSIMFGVPEERIDMSNWAEADRRVSRGEFAHNCGTTACAAGWAGVHPSFVKQGFMLEESSGTCGHNSNIVYNNPNDKAMRRYCDGWVAVEAFFGDELIFKSGTRVVTEEHSSGGSYKQHWAESEKGAVLQRIRARLLAEGAITKKRNKELEKQELAAGIK